MLDVDDQISGIQYPVSSIQHQAFSIHHYQLDFTTPGSLPWDAISLKQMRQIPNLRIYARGRPQIGQRLYPRTLNLGSRLAFIISAFFAKSASLLIR
jgi:hypothetical protein